MEVAWNRGKSDTVKSIFGNGNNDIGKPTNSEFIAIIADKIITNFNQLFIK
ncbi:MAG: hypothetical protein JJE17_00635 [Peptostreptococcaceae bacterium]|nr:hypothetical protein [Peptostreptococcaceae bacterium]